MIAAQKTGNLAGGRMMFTSLGTFVVWLVWMQGASFPSGRAPRREPLELTYVANSGVLVGSGDAKVLIDALFDKPDPEYRAPGQAPFRARIAPRIERLHNAEGSF